jgi:hypothetical protein
MGMCAEIAYKALIQSGYKAATNPVRNLNCIKYQKSFILSFFVLHYAPCPTARRAYSTHCAQTLEQH